MLFLIHAVFKIDAIDCPLFSASRSCNIMRHAGLQGYCWLGQGAGSQDQGTLWRRRVKGIYRVPSESIIRDVLVRIDPDKLDGALQQWNAAFGQVDQCPAIDGKTLCNAIDEQGLQTHIMSVIGHEYNQCYTQKKACSELVEGLVHCQ